MDSVNLIEINPAFTFREKNCSSIGCKKCFKLKEFEKRPVEACIQDLEPQFKFENKKKELRLSGHLNEKDEIEDDIVNPHALIQKKLGESGRHLTVISIPREEYGVVANSFRNFHFNFSLDPNNWGFQEYENLCITFNKLYKGNKVEDFLHSIRVGMFTKEITKFLLRINLNTVSKEQQKYLFELHKLIKHSISKDINDNKTLNGIYFAGMLHDVGKLMIPSWVLNKSGKLSKKEFELIKRHTTFGFEILSSVPGLKIAKEVAIKHHLRANGSGYIDENFKDKQITIPSQIVAFTDIMDALTTDRPYRKAIGYEVFFNALKQENKNGEMGFKNFFGENFEKLIYDYKDEISNIHTKVEKYVKDNASFYIY